MEFSKASIFFIIWFCIFPLQSLHAQTSKAEFLLSDDSLKNLEELQIENVAVGNIRFRTLLNLNKDDLSRGLSLQKGSVLTRAALYESMLALERRKIFERISLKLIYWQNSKGDLGVDVVFSLAPKLYISEVQFRGISTLGAKELQSSISVRAGQVLKPSELEKAKEKLLSRYRDAAHFDAEISVERAPVSVEPRVRVNFDIVEGYRSQIADIKISGELPGELQKSVDRLIKYAKGLHATKDNIERLRKEFLLVFRKESYLQTAVTVENQVYNALTGDVELAFLIKAKNKLIIEFEGNEEFSDEDLLEPLKLDSRSVPFSPAAVYTLRSDVESLYRSVGCYEVEVKLEDRSSGSDDKLYAIVIDEGMKWHIAALDIQGNSVFSDEELLEIISSKAVGRGLMRMWRPGFLIAEKLERDVEIIAEHYAARGYFGVKADYEVRKISKTGSAYVQISVQELEQSRLRDIELVWTGLAAAQEQHSSNVPAALLGFRSALKVGDPFTEKDIETERQRLLKQLHDHGFPTAKVEYKADSSAGFLQYYIDPGLQVRIGRIWLQGNVYTHDRVILRELDLASGNVWRSADLQAAQRNLYGLGFFHQISIGPLDGKVDSPVEDLRVMVSERNTGSLDLGSSFTSQDGLQLSSQLAQRNLFGNGSAAILGVSGFFKTGKRLFDAGRARLAYARPRFFDTKIDFSLEGYLETSITLIDQFSFDRSGISATWRYPFLEHLKGSAGYRIFNEHLFDVSDDIILGENDRGSTLYSMVEASIEIDRRDDSYNPKQGYRSVLGAGFAAKEAGSDVSLASMMYQQSIYTSLSSNVVWANNMRSELILPFSDTEVVPLGQRLFLGGRDSLRGFSRNAVGPRGGDNSVLGGDASIHLNTEIHYSITDNIVSLAFLDAGQAFLLNPGPFKGDTLNLADLRFSPGFGLHYLTPIGPIYGELGFALDRQFGEGFSRFNFGVGTQF